MTHKREAVETILFALLFAGAFLLYLWRVAA